MYLEPRSRHVGYVDNLVVVIHPARAKFGANPAGLQPVWYVELFDKGAWYYLPRKSKQENVEKFIASHGFNIDDLAWEAKEVELARIPPWETNNDYELVYFMEAIGANRIKIGITDSLHNRLTLVKTYSPFPVVIIGCMYGYREMETEIHHRFRHLRKNGEWFEGAEELRNYINSMTGGEAIPMIHRTLKGGDAVPAK